MPGATALVSHPACALHDTGWSHPEHQGRLPAIVKALYRQTPDLQEHVLQVEGSAAEVADLLRVHTASHIETVRAAVDRAAARGHPVDLTLDTIVSGASWDAAMAAAGSAITATRLVLDDGGPSTAFVLSRPPGHHATASRPMGFCLFNNIAVAARWAREEAGLDRVLIIDWDVHHGNGTQDIFLHDPSVYYLSLHLSGHYPGTGHDHETGIGAGKGTTRNVPLAPGVDREYYLEVFGQALEGATTSFDADLVLVSAGFDCLAGDPLGGLLLEPSDLHVMTRAIMEAAERAAHGRVVALLEGGYVPDRVGQGVVQVIRAFAGLPGGILAGNGR
ncbi:MAG: histone deacetylase [Gemmatimonadetes bacterium]|nr:histone deacetylase [Gemmatimonadota bacterium]